jgi:prepilin-type N-terminal cleavage/methylation domain-containing protein
MRKSQKGFTLIEILVVTAVGGILLIGLVTAIFHTLGVTMQSNTKIIALEGIKQVAHPIATDVRMAQTTDLVDGAEPQTSVDLFWTSWYDDNGELSPVDYHSEFKLIGEEVQRELKKNGVSIETTTLGKYISNIEFSRQEQIIFVSITSSPESRSDTAEKKTYHMYLQPKEDPVR